jgi:type IV pilus biogenesis protein CpaD/CtpE
MRIHIIALLLPLTLLGACAGSSDNTLQADKGYTIDVLRQGDGSLKAVPPSCLPWDESLMPNHSNDPLPQLGCVTRGNLARQIADPADLVRDQLPPTARTEHSDGDTMSTGVRRYREDKTYPLETSSPSTGTGG